MTCRAGRNADAGVIKMRKDALPVDVFKGDVCRVGQTLRTIRRTIQTRIRNVFQDLILEAIAQLFDASVIVVLERETARCAETDDVRNCRSAGAATLFLPAA